MISHSFSKIKDFEACPFFYKCTKMSPKKRVQPNPLMVVGRVMHNAIRIYHKHCLAKMMPHDFPKWEECAYMALEQESLPREYYDEVFAMMKSFAESHELSLESAVGVEEEIAVDANFKPCEWDSKDAWFRGVIDYLQIAGNIARITDYKTGWLMEADKLQFEIYAWLVKKLYPQVTEFHVLLDFVRHEWEQEYVIGEDELEGIEKRILTKTKRIEREEKFEPQVGAACSYCGCWRWCPDMKKHDVTFVMPKKLEDAVALALQLEKFTKLKEEANKVLKTYCDQTGDLEAGGRLYYFAVSQGWKFKSMADLLVEAEEAGVDLFDCLSIDSKKLKPLMESPAVKELVGRLGEKKISVRFTNKKAEKKEGKENDERTGEDKAEAV